MTNFRFVVAVSPRLPMPSLCEGGVYCDDSATRDDLDYYSNDFARADTDAADYNRRFGLDDTRYEVRDSLEGVDVSDPDVRASLVAWQLAALLVDLTKPALPPKADKTPDDFPPAVGAVNVAKAATPANIPTEWLNLAEGVAFNMIGRIVAKLAKDASGATKATDAYTVDAGKVEARGTMSLSGVTVRWVFVPSDPSGTRERQIITTHAVRLIAARMQSRLS